MAEECDTIQTNNPNIDYHIVTLFEKLEDLRNKQVVQELNAAKVPVQVEIRTLQLWKSVMAECIASFIYVFVVCGAAAGNGHGSALSSVLLASSLASGFAMTSLTQCFAHISGNLFHKVVRNFLIQYFSCDYNRGPRQSSSFTCYGYNEAYFCSKNNIIYTSPVWWRNCWFCISLWVSFLNILFLNCFTSCPFN